MSTASQKIARQAITDIDKAFFNNEPTCQQIKSGISLVSGSTGRNPDIVETDYIKKEKRFEEALEDSLTFFSRHLHN